MEGSLQMAPVSLSVPWYNMSRIILLSSVGFGKSSDTLGSLVTALVV